MSTENPSDDDKRGGMDLANAYLTSLHMPSYGELAQLVREAAKLVPNRSGEQSLWHTKVANAITRVPEPKYRVMNLRGQFYSKPGTRSTWVYDESQADVMERDAAIALARHEGAEAVPIL